MIKLLKKISFYFHSLEDFLNQSLFRKSKHIISLPDEVSVDEDLARNIIGGSKRKNIKKNLYDPNTGKIKPSKFLDTRNPRKVSVNRISTLTLEEAHTLGLQLRDEINLKEDKPQTYHGFGKLSVQVCLDAGCTKVEKDDMQGTKPYHANIVYPKAQKFDDMEIAIILAEHARLIRYEGLSVKETE